MASAAANAPPKATQAQLARLLGVSRQAIGDLIKRQIIPIDSAGQIDVDLARHALTNRVRPSGKAAAAASGQAELAKPTAQTPAAPAPETPDAEQSISYHVAKTLREVAEARLAQLKLAEQQGDLVRVADVTAALAGKASALREGLLQIPARLAPLLAAELDQARCHDILQTELRQVLAQLTTEIKRGA